MNSAKLNSYNTQKLLLVVSITLLVLKLAAYYLTGSVAVLTDALESIVNVIAALIGLYSLSLSALPKDANHPYGHGKVGLLGMVKTEFAKFGDVVEATKKSIDAAAKKFDEVGVRTRAIQKRLRDVQDLPAPAATTVPLPGLDPEDDPL